MSTLSLQLPESLHRQVSEVARRDGISVDQFVATALAEKLSALLSQEYLATRAGRGDRKRFEAALGKVPDGPPDPDDSI